MTREEFKKVFMSVATIKMTVERAEIVMEAHYQLLKEYSLGTWKIIVGEYIDSEAGNERFPEPKDWKNRILGHFASKQMDGQEEYEHSEEYIKSCYTEAARKSKFKFHQTLREGRNKTITRWGGSKKPCHIVIQLDEDLNVFPLEEERKIEESEKV